MAMRRLRKLVLGHPFAADYRMVRRDFTTAIDVGLVGALRLPDAALERLCDNIPLSRYVGVVRLTAEDIGSIDVLLDTTSTERNLQCLAVIRREAE
jgi:hypothetical protein